MVRAPATNDPAATAAACVAGTSSDDIDRTGSISRTSEAMTTSSPGMVSISSITGWSQPLRSSRKLALIDAVFANDGAPHPLHGPVHRLVRLEDPPHLAALLGRPLGRVEVQLVEARGHPRVLPLALD